MTIEFALLAVFSELNYEKILVTNQIVGHTGIGKHVVCVNLRFSRFLQT